MKAVLVILLVATIIFGSIYIIHLFNKPMPVEEREAVVTAKKEALKEAEKEGKDILVANTPSDPKKNVITTFIYTYFNGLKMNPEDYERTMDSNCSKEVADIVKSGVTMDIECSPYENTPLFKLHKSILQNLIHVENVDIKSIQEEKGYFKVNFVVKFDDGNYSNKIFKFVLDNNTNKVLDFEEEVK